MVRPNHNLKLNTGLSSKEARLSLILLSFFIALVHLFYFGYFLIRHFHAIAIYNFFAVVVYILCHVFVKKCKFPVAIYLTLTEILIQTVLVAYFLGNESGFYLFNLIVIIPILFHNNENNLLGSQKLGKLFFAILLDMVSFYLAYFIHLNYVPVYCIKENEIQLFYLINSGIAFIALLIMGYLGMKSAFNIAKSTLIDNRRLNSIASTDSLTRLLNRRSMNERLSDFYIKFEQEGVPFSVLMLDVDFFKQINDNYGHSVGDKVLVNLSDVIKSKLRYGDYASRWGGEEFLVALSAAGKGEALSVAERIRVAIMETPTVLQDGRTVNCRVTIGVATIASGMTVEKVIGEADEKLYLGKKSGRNRVVV